MGTSTLRPPSLALWIVLGLTGLAALVQGWTTYLPTAAVLVYGALRLRTRVRALKSAGAVSRKWTLGLVSTFALALVAGGHGVAPVGLFLFLGWKALPVPVALGWLAILTLVVGAWLESSLAPALAAAGAVLALLAWALFQASSDEPLAGALFSAPFLGCLGIYAVHLWRVRALASAPSP